MSKNNGGGDAHRRAVDIEVVAAVCEAGKGSPEHRELSRNLAELIIGTLIRLDKEGVLFDEILKQCGIPLGSGPADYRRHFRDLVHDAAGEAVPPFIDRWVIGGRWDPERAALSTCAIQAGLFAFVNEINLLRRQQQISNQELTPDGSMDLPPLAEERLRTSPAPAPGPEKTVVDRDEVRRHLAAAGPRVATMIQMTADGYTRFDIGEELGMHPEAIGSALRRFRSKF